jgi:hypothetical protein
MKATIVICVAAATAALAAGSASAKPAFHPAQTVTEQTLAKILKLDADKPDLVDPTGDKAGRRPRTTPLPGAPYLKYLTTPLATAILGAEAHQVKVACGGVYKAGELCGMDADPIICAQDFPDSYLFRTSQSGPSLAVVDAAWPPEQGAQPSQSGTYRLKLTGGVWKIDGIKCQAGDAYNWSAH